MANDHLPDGFRTRDLRPLVASLLGRDRTAYSAYSAYSRSAMSYDLRRLRLKGLLQRLPHTTRYLGTPLGLHVALWAMWNDRSKERPVEAPASRYGRPLVRKG